MLKVIVKKALGDRVNYFNDFRYKNTENKYLLNIYKTQYTKNALLSYLVTPFLSPYISHTNSFEATSWALVLSELGYNVDVINHSYRGKLDLSRYDVICGFGDVFQLYFESPNLISIPTINYATGMHVCVQNINTLQRLKDVYQKKGIWLAKSARFVDKTWTHQASLSNAVIALGNEVCANSYRRHSSSLVYALSSPFYDMGIATKVFSSRQEASRTHFLWFGSSGLIHKGLDLLLDYFMLNNHLTLHICGGINSEPDFIKAYNDELTNYSNIISHGFVDISTDKFIDILSMCSFTIFPSCSEGGSPSVITTIGNGGLIPVITKETTISTGNEIWIDGFDYISIEKAIKASQLLSWSEIKQKQKENYDYVQNNNNQAKYKKDLTNYIKIILV